MYEGRVATSMTPYIKNVHMFWEERMIIFFPLNACNWIEKLKEL